MTKSSPLIWHLLHNVKLTVKISSIIVAFLKDMNFDISGCIFRQNMTVFRQAASNQLIPPPLGTSTILYFSLATISLSAFALLSPTSMEEEPSEQRCLIYGSFLPPLTAACPAHRARVSWFVQKSFWSISSPYPSEFDFLHSLVEFDILPSLKLLSRWT